MKKILILTVLLLWSVEAHAYIDPGSGSAIMSAIIGFFVVIGLSIKSFWYKIKSFFTGKSAADDETIEDQIE